MNNSITVLSFGGGCATEKKIEIAKNKGALGVIILTATPYFCLLRDKNSKNYQNNIPAICIDEFSDESINFVDNLYQTHEKQEQILIDYLPSNFIYLFIYLFFIFIYLFFYFFKFLFFLKAPSPYKSTNKRLIDFYRIFILLIYSILAILCIIRFALALIYEPVMNLQKTTNILCFIGKKINKIL